MVKSTAHNAAPFHLHPGQNTPSSPLCAACQWIKGQAPVHNESNQNKCDQLSLVADISCHGFPLFKILPWNPADPEKYKGVLTTEMKY